MNAMTEIPSLSLLIKLMNMTTSSNDGEALVALRKANDIVRKFDSWEAILRGRVTVIGDPFADLTPPPPSRPMDAPTPPTPPRPRARPTPPPPVAKPKPAPAPTPQPQGPYFSKNSNGYWNVRSTVPLAKGDVITIITKKGNRERVTIQDYVESNIYGDRFYQFTRIATSLADVL